MSFKYMIYLSAARYLISTDAIRHFYIWDSPNSIYKVLYQARKNIVFLQHGVMGFKQCHRTFHKGGGNQMALFVVSSGYEQKIIMIISDTIMKRSSSPDWQMGCAGGQVGSGS